MIDTEGFDSVFPFDALIYLVDGMNERKKVTAFFGNFRYFGELLEETDTTYKIDDTREGIIILPKANTVLKVMQDD